MGITFHPHTKHQRFDSWIFFKKICFKSSILDETQEIIEPQAKPLPIEA
jgi:hypothetical protein